MTSRTMRRMSILSLSQHATTRFSMSGNTRASTTYAVRTSQFFFFLMVPAPPEIYTLPLPAPLPISGEGGGARRPACARAQPRGRGRVLPFAGLHQPRTHRQHRDDAARHEAGTHHVRAERTTLSHCSSELGRGVVIRVTPTPDLTQERCQTAPPAPNPTGCGGWWRLGEVGEVGRGGRVRK